MAVTGVMPDGKISCESRAFKNVDLPLENCPTIATFIGSNTLLSSFLNFFFSFSLGFLYFAYIFFSSFKIKAKRANYYFIPHGPLIKWDFFLYYETCSITIKTSSNTWKHELY